MELFTLFKILSRADKIMTFCSYSPLVFLDVKIGREMASFLAVLVAQFASFVRIFTRVTVE